MQKRACFCLVVSTLAASAGYLACVSNNAGPGPAPEDAAVGEPEAGCASVYGPVPCVDSTAPGLDAAPDSTLVDANEPEDATANAPDASDGGPAPDGATLTDGAASDGGPIVVTSGLASPSMLLLSNGNLFFYEIDTADIGEVSVNGGAVTRFEVGSSDPALTFTADANNIYWATVGGNVFQQGLTAASPLQIGTSVATEPYTLISDGTFVYWVEYLGNGRVRRIAVGGSTSDAGALTGELLYPSAIAFVGTQLYVDVTAGTLSEGTMNALLPEGGLAPIVGGLVDPYTFTTDGTRLYWSGIYAPPYPVGSVGLDGGGAVQYGGTPSLSQIAADGVSLYVASSAGIQKTPVGSAAYSTLVSGAGYTANSIAVDSAWVYWTVAGTGSNGAVYKIAK